VKGTLSHRVVPRLEALEDRTVPSTLIVINVLDTGALGDGSLCGEIAAAQSGDTINFAPSLLGQTITLTVRWFAPGPSMSRLLVMARPVSSLAAIGPQSIIRHQNP
jgi:hypothetical protein